ncbi:ATP-binding protein [Lachnospiraceae bacterium MD335]|nr:ATP-binding protein [Lachnospiraceae bacterium MD335]
MELYLKNIGKVAEAKVEIKGVTVVAGENDTGKSTVGRALFSLFNSFYEIGDQIRQERIASIVSVLRITYGNTFFITDDLQAKGLEEYAEEILDKAQEYKKDIKLLEKDIQSGLIVDGDRSESYFEAIDVEDVAKRVYDILCVPDDDIFQSVINKKINAEFNGQLLNIYADTEGVITLKVKDEELTVNVFSNAVSVSEINHCLHTEAIYIDDPFVLDDMNLRMLQWRLSYADHRIQLEHKLAFNQSAASVVDELVVEKKFEKIYEMLSSVCSGTIVKQKNRRVGYRLKNSLKTLSIKNLSTGLKTFAILKTLLSNGAITDNGTIILDEPEIHLHPEWQLRFAELIVLLYKEFHMHILLNTHSPYFLRAIEVYAAKYGVSDICRYYLAEVNEEGSAYISDVTTEIDKIYAKLSKPLQRLEDERWNID